jgi:hypothetical protein
MGTNEVGIFTDGFCHIFENDSAFFSFFFEFMVDDGRVILSAHSCEIFFFAFGDLEAVEDVSDICRDSISFRSYRISFFRKRGGVIDNVFKV